MSKFVPLPLIVAATLPVLGCDSERQPTQPTSRVAESSNTLPLNLPPPAPMPAPPDPGPSSDPLVGRYALTITLGECAAIPGGARTRSYSAAIGRRDDGYVVTLGDATFLQGPICTLPSGKYAGLGCHMFLASRLGDDVVFSLVNNNDDAHGGHINEQLADGTWMELIGEATGRYGRQTIVATGSSSLWYCPTSRSYPFPCAGFVGCKPDMELTFTRQ